MLTPGEGRVLALVAEGYTNAEIAKITYRGIDGVKTHVRQLHMKFGARNRAHIVALAYQQGYLKLPDADSKEVVGNNE